MWDILLLLKTVKKKKILNCQEYWPDTIYGHRKLICSHAHAVRRKMRRCKPNMHPLTGHTAISVMYECPDRLGSRPLTHNVVSRNLAHNMCSVASFHLYVMFLSGEPLYVFLSHLISLTL